MTFRLPAWLGNWPTGLACFAVPLLLYCLTMPRDVVFEDDGLFLLNGVFLGLEHPPGYPVFTVVHHLFQQVPWGTAAVKGHLLSALFASGACVMGYLTLVELGVRRVFALVGALLLALSEHLWSQAVITEVYTLNCLLFFGAAFCVVRLWRCPGNRLLWALGGMCIGVGVANVWPLMALSAPALALGLRPLQGTPLKVWSWGVGSLVLCVLLPYGWLYWYGANGADFSFAGPFSGVGDFFSFVGRRFYEDVDVQPTWGVEDFVSFTGWMAVDVARQLSYWGLVAVAAGLLLTLPTAGRARRLLRVPELDAGLARFAVFSLVALGCHSVLLLLLLRNDFNDHMLAVFHPYPLVAYSVAALWVGVGLEMCYRWSSGRWSGLWPRTAAWCIAVLVGVSALGFTVLDSWERVDRRGDRFAVSYANLVLESLPPEAVLVVSGDSEFPLAYLHFIEGVRPDIRIVHPLGLVYPSNYYRLGSYGAVTGLDATVVRALLDKNLEREEHPVYFALLAAGGVLLADYDHQGLVLEKRSVPLSDGRLPMADVTRRHGEWLAAADPADATGKSRVDQWMKAYCSFLAGSVLLGDDDAREFATAFVDGRRNNPFCMVGVASVVVEYGGALLSREPAGIGGLAVPESIDLAEVDSWLDDAEAAAVLSRVPDSLLVDIYNARGQSLILRGDMAAAMEYFADSAALDPSVENLGAQMVAAAPVER